MKKADTSVFGSPLRDRILVLLATKGTSHLREVARIYSVSVPQVQRAMKQLELDGLVTGRSIGRSRLLELSPRFYAMKELRALVNAMAIAQPNLYEPAQAVRTRPRRSGKPL